MNGRIRVLHLIGEVGPFGYPFLSLLAANIDRNRFDLRFGSLQRPGWLQDEARAQGWGGFSLQADSRKEYPRAVGRLIRCLRREAVDVVHTHSFDASLVGLLGARAARQPIGVVTAHYPHETPLHQRRALSITEWLTLGHLAHRVVAPSEQMRETLVETLHIPAKKVQVVEHGFELDRFDPARIDGSRARSEFGLDGRLVIGSIGRFYWVKNQDELLRAFAELSSDFPEAVLLMAGSGDREPVQRLARQLGIQDRVLIVPFREDMPELLAAMDVFVHPALAESFGLVIVEAMAMAKPVLSTPVGIAPDLLADGKAGLLSSNGRSESLEAGLRELLARRSRWNEMGSAGRRLVERFTVPRMISGYEKLYEEQLSRFRR